MKLIFVNRYFHPDISATAQMLSDLAFDQAARGREVHVVASRQLYEDARAALAAEETIAGVHVHRVATTRRGRAGLAGRTLDYLSFHVSAARALARLAGPADVIIAKTDPPLVSATAAWAARRRGAALVNWTQDLFPEVATELGVRIPALAAACARRVRDWSLRVAATNVVVGERMAQRVRQSAPGTRVEVIGNWADGALVRPLAPASNRLRAEWGLADRFVVGYSGNMGRAHEFEAILDACERLRGEPDCVFLFVGAGARRAWIEGEAARRSLTNVVLRPYQPRAALAESLGAADVHLVTLHPRLEGLVVPSKAYAALAAGRPIVFVGDPEGEIARLASGCGCGIAVPAGDGAGVAEAVRRLRRDPLEREAMGRAARAHFERHHDKAISMARWDAVLSRLAGAPGRGAAQGAEYTLRT